MRQNIRVFIAVISAIVLVGIVLLALQISAEDETPPPSNPTPLPPPGAPQPLEPLDGTAFVESALTLAWDWPALAERQTFAVRVWFGEDAPREVWTSDTRLDAQEMIDSYSQEVGPFYWQVAVIQVAEGGGFERMVSDWSPIQALNRVRHISPAPYPQAQQSPLTRHILAQNLPSATAIIDYTRVLIYDNAIRQPDQTDDKNVVAIQMMYDHIQGQGDKPSLWCDGRATAFMTLLREMGIDSRLIFYYGDNTSQIQEHTMLEVFNPDTQTWEVQDALYNLYYLDAETQQRASVERLVFGPLDTIVVCGETIESCSAEAVEEYQKYFEAFRYGYSDTFWVNPDRFDVSIRFPNNDFANLAEYLTGNPRDFKFIFDSWTKGNEDSATP
jgi:hypothetical protein